MSVSDCVSKAYRKLNKCFQHLEREHEDLKKTNQAHLVDFVLETTSAGDLQDNFVCKEVKTLLDEKVSSGRKILLKDYRDLEERVKSLTSTREDSEEEYN